MPDPDRIATLPLGLKTARPRRPRFYASLFPDSRFLGIWRVAAGPETGEPRPQAGDGGVAHDGARYHGNFRRAQQMRPRVDTRSGGRGLLPCAGHNLERGYCNVYKHMFAHEDGLHHPCGSRLVPGRHRRSCRAAHRRPVRMDRVAPGRARPYQPVDRIPRHSSGDASRPAVPLQHLTM